MGVLSSSGWSVDMAKVKIKLPFRYIFWEDVSFLKGLRHVDFTVLRQSCVKIITYASTYTHNQNTPVNLRGSYQ